MQKNENKKIIIFNVGSSSCKFHFFSKELDLLGKGLIEKIGIPGTLIKFEDAKGNKIEELKDFKFESLDTELVEFLEEREILKFEDVYLMAHRVVNGGSVFTNNLIVDSDEIMDKLISLNHLAPLHNTFNNSLLKRMRDKYPKCVQVAVFDTAFHSTIPEINYTYAIPEKFKVENQIRKYGAHGSSHGYITEIMEEHLGKKVNIINAHLGNGSSLCVTNQSKSINTSMGFTPLDGLMMGTRSGAIDPSVVLTMIQNLGLSAEEVNTILNKKSGFLGVSGVSSDMREVGKAADSGNERAKFALDLYAKRVSDYISMYLSEVDSIDAITFTGGIGENAKDFRVQILENIKQLNIKIDENATTKGKVSLISKSDSDIPVYVVPTNEELYMAKIAKRLNKEEV